MNSAIEILARLRQCIRIESLSSDLVLGLRAIERAPCVIFGNFGCSEPCSPFLQLFCSAFSKKKRLVTGLTSALPALLLRELRIQVGERDELLGQDGDRAFGECLDLLVAGDLLPERGDSVLKGLNLARRAGQRL